jgi:hypothetical protein
VALLKKMVAEDEVHARRPAKAEKDMTEEERVAEWIFQLRDQQAGWQFSGEFIDIFLDPRGEESPAHQLLGIGPTAVPQLIAVLGDRRFTRANSYRSRHDRTPDALRVGDCAYAILRRIAGRSFRQSSKALAEDDDAAAVERVKEVEAWWKEFQAKGEKRMLVEGTAAGDWNCLELARRLVLKYPDVAFDALAKGVGNAREDSIRSELVNHLAPTFDARAIPLLRKELKGPFPGARVTAARALLRQGREEGVQAMIQEWKDWVPEPEHGRDGAELIEFLAECSRLDTIRALADGLGKRPVRVRFRVIEAFEDSPFRERSEPTDAVKLAIEDLLAWELEHTEKYQGFSIGRDNKQCQDPRVCDFAGDVLSRFWKQPDLFDMFGSPSTRERQRTSLRNTWRLRRGLPLLPVPDRKSDGPM